MSEPATRQPADISSSPPLHEADAAAPPNAPAVPRLKSLVPDGSFATRLDPPPADNEQGHTIGRTIQNTGPPSPETLRAQREVAAQAVTRRVDGWARDDIAEIRVRSGAVDDYFRQLGKALERAAQLQRPLQLDVAEGLRRNVDGYLQDAARYGATGLPHMPAGPQTAHTTFPDPNGTHRIAAATADQHARVQEVANRFGPGELVVVVELAQDASGRVRELVVVRSSGDPLFDAHITQVATELGPVEGLPDHVAARSPNGIRTTWEFRGRYDFRKKLREMSVDNPADAAYLAAIGLGSLFAGGSFDEVTGDIYVIDVRDPKFQVRATLLRLY